VSPRRKRRTAKVENSLRLFAMLAVLGAVNIYVFFFDRGTAPREILKPSSSVKAAEGGAEALRLEAAAARLTASAEGLPSDVLAPLDPPRPRPPVAVAPAKREQIRVENGLEIRLQKKVDGKRVAAAVAPAGGRPPASRPATGAPTANRPAPNRPPAQQVRKDGRGAGHTAPVSGR
jgi:hypothetical protein